MSRSRHLVDPELLPLLEAFPTVTVNQDNLAEMRTREIPLPPVEDHGVDWEECEFDGPETKIGVRI